MLSAAAEAGSWRSSVMLGMLARDGKAMPKDQQAAYRWFRIATLQGENEARPFLNHETETVVASVPAAERKAIDDQTLVWFQAHPHNDIYRFENEPPKKFFPMQEIEATLTSQTPEPSTASAENHN